MSSKFMKVKRIVVSAITCVLLVSQLIGCAAMSSTEMMNFLDSGSDVEITMAAPAYSESVVQVPQQEYVWQQLDQLETYNEGFRPGFDKLFNINIVTENGVHGKSGCMFINEAGERDGNTTFSDSLRNKPFMTKYMADSAVTSKISELASGIYADVNEGSSHSVYAGLNAYFNLFNEVKDKDIYFNANQSLTREDFYSFVYRVNNGVSELQEDAEFNQQVGTSGGSNIFASQVDEYAWLNVDNNGLRPGNYKSSITRAEAVYMLMNYYFKDNVQSINVKDISLADAKDGGDMLTTGREKLQITDKETKEVITADGWQLGVLAKMQQGNKGYVHTDIYKALGVANGFGIIGSETDWNGPLTKSDAIDMIVKIHQVLNIKEGYLTTAEYGTMVGNDVIDREELEGIVDEQVVEEENTIEDEETVEENTSTESLSEQTQNKNDKPVENKQPPKQETKQQPKQETKQQPKQETKQQPKQETKQQPKQETKQQPKQETKQQPKQETKQPPKQEDSTGPLTDWGSFTLPGLPKMDPGAAGDGAARLP